MSNIPGININGHQPQVGSGVHVNGRQAQVEGGVNVRGQELAPMPGNHEPVLFHHHRHHPEAQNGAGQPDHQNHLENRNNNNHVPAPDNGDGACARLLQGLDERTRRGLMAVGVVAGASLVGATVGAGLGALIGGVYIGGAAGMGASYGAAVGFGVGICSWFAYDGSHGTQSMFSRVIGEGGLLETGMHFHDRV